jgi:hypothetical protein
MGEGGGLQRLFVTLAAVAPAWEPAVFVAFGGGVLDAAGQDLGAGVGEGRGGVLGKGGRHGLEDLEEAPAFAAVAFGGGGAFAFEIDVVDEGEGAFGGGGEGVEILPDACGGGACGGEHLGQSGAGALHDELGLLADGGAEELAQFALAGAGLVGEESGAACPRAGAVHPGGGGDAMPGEVLDQAGEAFLEGAAATGGIPDEVADAEGGEVFTGVPAGEALDGAATFILPDALADAVELGGAEAGRCLRPGGRWGEGATGEEADGGKYGEWPGKEGWNFHAEESSWSSGEWSDEKRRGSGPLDLDVWFIKIDSLIVQIYSPGPGCLFFACL